MTRPTVPGVLDLTALAASADRLTWSPDGHRLTTPDGYAIAADGRAHAKASSAERWYVATDPSGREVAIGYGEHGLAKCKRYCERHASDLRIAQLANSLPAPAETPISNNAEPAPVGQQPLL